MATDLYATIHKAIRYALTRFHLELGATDPGSREACSAIAARFDDLVELLEKHAHHEEEFVHPLVKRVSPNVLEKLEAAHAGQDAELASISASLRAAVGAEPSERGAHLARAYRAMAAFLASYFTHMEDEELLAQPALTRGFSEDELAATHMALVGSIDPDSMVRFLRIMMPAMHVEERVGMLTGMMAAPPHIAEMFLVATRDSLEPHAFDQVATRLGLDQRQVAA